MNSYFRNWFAALGFALTAPLVSAAALAFIAEPASASMAHHTAGPFGFGVVLGEPTGLSAKYRFSRTDAFDFGLAYNFNSYVELFADYLYHFPGVFGARNEFVSELTPYLGIGGRFFSDNAPARPAGLGVRIPFGIEWRPGHPPLGVFVELVPGIGIIPSTFGFLSGGVGIRYYF